MRKLVLSMHTSLDGFVAGPNGEMNWIKVDDELFDYSGKLTDLADTALYGRVTYQMMERYWPTAADQPNPTNHDIQHSRWYNRVAKVVISNTMKGKKIPNTLIIGGNIQEQIRKLKQQPGKSILIFGSPTASHSLMKHDLIDEYWLFVNPVLLGEGIAFFSGISKHVKLRLEETKVFQSGVIAMHYSSLITILLVILTSPAFMV